MIGRVIAFCARERLLTLVVVAALAMAGWWSLGRMPLDAIPDISDTQVIVLSEWSGHGPTLVEDQVTYPLVSLLLATPKARYVRGQSMLGTSFIYVVFEDGTDPYWARNRVLEALIGARDRLPEGVSPTLGPDASALGWVLEYALVDDSGRHDLAELRSIQDFHLRYALGGVPGVAEVAAIGGVVKRYQIEVDPARLAAHDLTTGDIVAAVRDANGETGGDVLDIAGHEHVIQGRGYLRGREDIEAVPLRVTPAYAPLRIGDVAAVTLGADSRRGIAELDGRGEVVGAVVVMRSGENALRVIDDVKARIDELKAGLPEGVRIEITYDRSELIRGAVTTLRDTLVQEMLVVALIILVFLGRARSALVPIVGIAVAVLLAFVPMLHFGVSANIMSLGGIAVAIGAMVDAAIVMVENIHKRMENVAANCTPRERAACAVAAMTEVGPTLFFSLLVITVSFLPVFSLEGVEGRLFRPLAVTKTLAMAFAAILAITLVPAISALVIQSRARAESEQGLSRFLIRHYSPIVRLVVRRPRTVLSLAAAMVVLTIPVALQLRGEFMPPLDEGVLLYMPTSPPGMSVAEARRLLQVMDQELKTIPEVARVFGKAGRAETATDPAPLSMFETVIELAPRQQWRKGLTRESLLRELDTLLNYPGMPNVWWMPIQTRAEMTATGLRSPVGIQVRGRDQQSIAIAAAEVERVVATVPGTRSAYAERHTGGAYIDVVIDRARAGRYGLTARDVNDVVEVAIGGRAVTTIVAGRERYPVSVRYARDFRDRADQLAKAFLRAPGGEQVPLGAVADIRFVTGPAMIQSENGQLFTYVLVDPGSTAIVDWVKQARTRLTSATLPAGTDISYTGQYRHYERARQRLLAVVPATLLLVVLLLYFNTRSWTETGIVLLAVPFSLIGAVWLLALLDYNLSVAVWVGLIALAGLDAETGVVMLLYLKLAYRQREVAGRLVSPGDLEDAIVEGAALRIRPKLMTVLTDILGLLPLLFSSGPGADVMKRMAAPMVGGLVTSFLLELTVYPALFALWKGRKR